MIKINLSAILGRKRISQLELARRTEIRPNTINDLYNELAISVKFEHLDKICEELDCDLSELLEYIPKKKK